MHHLAIATMTHRHQHISDIRMQQAAPYDSKEIDEFAFEANREHWPFQADETQSSKTGGARLVVGVAVVHPHVAVQLELARKPLPSLLPSQCGTPLIAERLRSHTL